VKREACIEELLVLGLDDWVHLSEVAWTARSIGGAASPEDVRQLSLQSIRDLLVRELATFGQVDETGYRPWRSSIEETVGRIDREWALSAEPRLGEGGWIRLTPAGDAAARELLSGRGADPPDAEGQTR